MATGRLRIHLGVAPGVGTTHALLDEAQRRAERGRTVVVGQLDAPAPGLDRPLGDGPWDAAGLLALHPDVVLLDDLGAPLAGTDRPRWTAVEELLAGGCDVLATAHITQVASLADVVEQLTGTRPTTTVPDALFSDAAAVELVDMAPEALRRRLAHGRLLGPEAMDAATAARWSPESLAGLRELAFAWLGALLRSGGTPGAETRERLLVGASGRAAGNVLRRAARLARCTPGASVLAVEVVPTTSGRGRPAGADEAIARLASELGIEHRLVVSDDVTTGLLDVARAEHATQLIVGSGGGRRGPAAALVERAADVDVVVVPAPAAATTAHPPRRPGVGRARLGLGFALAVALPVALTAVGLAGNRWLGVTGVTLVQLLAVVVVALVGGLWPALLAAVVGSQLINWFFIPPFGSLDVAEPHNLATLAVFVVVGALVGAVVHRASVGATVAAREAAASRSLAALAEATINRTEALPRMLEQGRASFGMTSASLLRRRVPGGGWLVVDEVGDTAPTTPEHADVAVTAGPDLVLAMNGRTLAASDQTVLRAFAAQTQNLLERDELARSAAVAERLEATEKLRDSLLVAVGHDLRRPLASARASVEGLRGGLALSDADRADLLADATEALARLSRIVDDLLDLSRLQTGALRVNREPVWLDEVVPPALDDVGSGAADVRVTVPDDLPPADADAALVRRIVSNLVGNALEHGAGAVPPWVRVSATADRIEVRVIDRGPGLADRQRVFEPFQRRGDTSERGGLGLGLALSRGLAEAMGGRLDAEDTPGGGATFVLALPAAADTLGPAEVGRRERGEP